MSFACPVQDLLGAATAERFISRYRDIGGFLIRVMDIEEILVEKMCAIIERSIARDLYDSYFIFRHMGVRFNTQMFAKKAKLRGYKADIGALIKSIEGIGEATWKEELSYIVAPLPKIGEVKSVIV